MWLLGLFIAICVFCSIFCSYYEMKGEDHTDNDDSGLLVKIVHKN